MNRVDRFVLRAFIAWQAFTVRCAMQASRLAANREIQNRAVLLTEVAAVLLLIALHVKEG